ncbi:MAG: dTDP-4-dehydrorhamnose 3,5-epimerase [Lutibacter sp.]|uniref:dTDP-4-dehydrorhamnose 3,5-epimerase n=1 Tax=Lutibacter sp. TaxID=1925666 RepID=UPI0017C32695|nr:dTDP-4-dehydrorhamnose 3,5-epimerase [Lutibacter sp.]MBT8316792.1 dTDP-4-dehydrorhamnose 3,5-epimerase [Lutibacter sp.]NNJ57652.1 dTDP-4-dehydrorhamnose 3,5-epimerase [Lutibacter sp.]
MKFTRTEIPDVIVCEPNILKDERGYFFESFKKELFEAFIGSELQFTQDNEAKSTKGVLRGLHYQLPPFAQTKLVRVIKGCVLDIAVDIRQHSPTFGQYEAIELSDKNKLQLYIPKGFAHGYVVLSDEAIFSYKVDNYYNKESERGIMFNDPALQIDWQLPANELIISEKDKNQPLFKQADLFV